MTAQVSVHSVFVEHWFESLNQILSGSMLSHAPHWIVTGDKQVVGAVRELQHAIRDILFMDTSIHERV